MGSKKKIVALIIGVVVVIAALIGGGIYVGGRMIDQQKQEQAEKEAQEAQAQAEAEAKAKAEAEAQKEEEARLQAEEEQRQQEEAAKAAALAQAEQMKTAIMTIGLPDVQSYAISERGVQPTEAPEETPAAPTTTTGGHLIAIDAGHQTHGNSEREPIGPGASETKAKVSSGTHGNTSGLNEYELNLMVSLKLRDVLQARGYQVYMIRETNDVNISNSERAQMAAAAGAEILVRVHANGSDDTSVHGALTMEPSSSNPFLSHDLIAASQRLSQVMIESICLATGANNMGVQQFDNMSGINWSTIPVTIVEMGFMTNPSEDALMATDDYQNKMATGIADGVDAYFYSE